MSSRTANKPEITALFRLEFYKNKKKWILSNQKTKAVGEPRNAESCHKLNETYDIDLVVDSEKAAYPQNNALRKDIPTADSPQLDSSKSSQQWTSPMEHPEPDLVPVPTPQIHNDIYRGQDKLPRPQKIHEDWSTGQEFLDQESLKKRQDPDILANNTDASENPWPNNSQPGDQLQWLLKAASMRWTQQPPGNPGLWNQPPPGLHLNSCIDQAKIDGSKLLHPKSCGYPSSTVAVKDENIAASPASLNTHQQNTWSVEDHSKWTHQVTTDTDQKYPVTLGPTPQKPDPGSQWNWTDTDHKYPATVESSLQKPDSTFQKTLTPDNWHDQICPLKYLPDIWPANSPQLGLHRPTAGQQRSHQDMFHFYDEGPQDIPQKFVPEEWSNQRIYADPKDHAWNYAVPPSSPELLQKEWTNPLWQEKHELYQYPDKVCRESADVLDGVPDDEEDTMYKESQYMSGNLRPVEQYMVKQQLPLEYPEVLTGETVIQNLNVWLVHLMDMFRQNDYDFKGCESLELPLAYGSDIEFVREAHEVPHSSEKDPNESNDCPCSWVTRTNLAEISPPNLASATIHAATMLRMLLSEQVTRDQLRAQPDRNLDQHPTRDTSMYGHDYVLSGSHIPQSTAELDSTPPQRLIRMYMGRPYRL